MVAIFFRRVPWRWPLVVAICLLVVVPLGAQDEDPPEFADRGMLIQAASIGFG